MKTRILTIAVTFGLLSVVGPFAIGAASATEAANSEVGIAHDCNVGNINNGVEWTGYPSTGSSRGHAHFREYGEILEVVDTNSNGQRIYVRFIRCSHPTDVLTIHDSGPNEGPTDVETYNFDLPEGLRIIFQVCEGSSTTACGAPVHANA